MIAALALTLLVAAPRAADCDKTWSTEFLDLSLAAVEEAFAGFDKQAVSERYQRATSQLQCLAEPLAPGQAAHFHRVTGLVRFLEHQDDASRLAFAASRAIAPELALPAALAPEGHPLRAYYVAVDPTPLPEEALSAAADGTLLRDGGQARSTRRALPAIFQLVEPSGVPAWTVLVQPGDPLPAYEVSGEAADAQEPPATQPPVPEPTLAPEPTLGLVVEPPPGRTPGAHPGRPLLMAAGGTALVSALTYGLAWKAHADWEGAADAAAADAAYRRDHALLVTSGASIVVTAGLGVGAVLAARF